MTTQWNEIKGKQWTDRFAAFDRASSHVNNGVYTFVEWLP